MPSQVLAPAQSPPVGTLCSAAIVVASDGTATPLMCKSGALNVQAWSFYATVSASLLGLGSNPTEGQVGAAICDDIKHNHATNPQESSAYTLATAYYGWTFGNSPVPFVCQ